MKDFFYNLSFFLAKILAAALSLLLIIFVVVTIIKKQEISGADRIVVEKLNDKYESIRLAMQKQLVDGHEYKKILKKAEKNKDKKDKQVFVLNFKGDMNASAVKTLREEITAVLSVADAGDEVILCMESYGGTFHSYGLAVSQLQRIKDKKVPLTIAVDKAAASGGYMLACMADRLVAAPYAIVGSIGVILAMPNFHRFLKKHDIDYEQITSGEYKRILTMFGENTEKDRNKAREQVKDAFRLFKDHIIKYRSIVDLEKAGTGEYWYASQAQSLSLNLVDELMTSDDLLLATSREADIYKVRYIPQKTLSQYFRSALSLIIGDTLQAILNSSYEQP